MATFKQIFLFSSLSMLPRCILFLLFAFLPACSGEQARKPEAPPVPVKAISAVQKTVPVQITAIGNVEAYSTVAIKAQVGGLLRQVYFQEGQEVHKGERLFTLDSGPYEAALRQAEANLARDAAQLENARLEAQRFEGLAQKGYAALSQYDQVRANFEALTAAVNADRAAIDNARLQLGYCVINAPITGKTGDLLAHEGNLIKANADTAMVVINQIQPIYVAFAVPEQNLTELKKFMAAGPLRVGVVFPENQTAAVQGDLSFIDNRVDVATATIRLKATFANQEKLLWPGQFVNVILTLTEQPDAVVVPSQAVQTGQQGQYAFVIKEDKTVEIRPLEVARSIGNESVINKGLQPGEVVVTDGQLRLIPGARVEVASEAGGGAK